jgi:transposase
VNKNNRKHRGLYVCNNCGSVLNADVNGAKNILKKVAPESVRIGSSGGVNLPVRIRLPFGKQTPHEATLLVGW